MNLHEFLSKCLKKWHSNIVVLFVPYENAKCSKTEQDFRTCNILQTAPHTRGQKQQCARDVCNKHQFTSVMFISDHLQILLCLFHLQHLLLLLLDPPLVIPLHLQQLFLWINVHRQISNSLGQHLQQIQRWVLAEYWRFKQIDHYSHSIQFS